MKMRRQLVVHTMEGSYDLCSCCLLTRYVRGHNTLYNYAALPTQNEAPNDVMLGERNSLHNYFRGNEWLSPQWWARQIKEGAGVQGSFCRPAAVRRYPGAVVAGSARTRSTRAAPAISGVNGSPIFFRYASSVWPPRAAYARTPRLPTSPNGVILGITAVT